MIADSWSVALLADEVAMSYVALQAGAPPPLPRLAVRYVDFARREREAIARSGADLLEYWKRQLAGVPPLLTLSSRPRPAARSLRGARHAFAVEATLVRALAERGRPEDATLFMVMLAVYEMLLFRLTGQEDFCVGVPTAGRLDADLEGVLGCFTNTLPIRADLSGNPTWQQLLGRVRRTMLDGLAHQAVPFGQIVEHVRTARSTSYTPLFQVVFDFNSTPRPTGGAEGSMDFELFNVPLATAKTDVIVDLVPAGDGGLQGSVEYDVSLFDAADITQIVQGFLGLLAAVIADPGGAVTAYRLHGTTSAAADRAARDRLEAVRSSRRSRGTTGAPRPA
jgi:hypothetical protein